MTEPVLIPLLLPEALREEILTRARAENVGPTAWVVSQVERVLHPPPPASVEIIPPPPRPPAPPPGPPMSVTEERARFLAQQRQHQRFEPNPQIAGSHVPPPVTRRTDGPDTSSGRRPNAGPSRVSLQVIFTESHSCRNRDYRLPPGTTAESCAGTCLHRTREANRQVPCLLSSDSAPSCEDFQGRPPERNPSASGRSHVAPPPRRPASG